MSTTMKAAQFLALGGMTVLALGSAKPATAVTYCAKATVEAIQVQNVNVLVMQSDTPVWRAVGSFKDTAGAPDPSTHAKLATLLAAQMEGKPVQLRYNSDTYDCSAYNYSVPTEVVRIFTSEN